MRWRATSCVVDGVLTASGVYLIHFAFTNLFLLGAVPPDNIIRPDRRLPIWIFRGWDSAYYNGLFHVVDRYSFPPLYPLTLRVVSFVARYH